MSTDQPVNVDPVNNEGSTPLFLAKYSNYDSIAKTLIKRGANHALAELLIQQRTGEQQSTLKKSAPGSIYQTVKHVRNILQIREALGNIYGLFE